MCGVKNSCKVSVIPIFALCKADQLTVLLLHRDDHILVQHSRGRKDERITNHGLTGLPNGPYLIDSRSGTVYAVARRYKDTLHAFLGGGIDFDRSTGKYKHLNTTVILSSRQFSIHLPKCHRDTSPHPDYTTMPVPQGLWKASDLASKMLLISLA